MLIAFRIYLRLSVCIDIFYKMVIATKTHIIMKTYFCCIQFIHIGYYSEMIRDIFRSKSSIHSHTNETKNIKICYANPIKSNASRFSLIWNYCNSIMESFLWFILFFSYHSMDVFEDTFSQSHNGVFPSL